MTPMARGRAFGGLFLALAMLGFLTPAVLGQENGGSAQAEEELDFKSLADDNYGRGANESVIGGFEATPRFWRSIFYAIRPGQGSCTAALIGPDTLLTAAHCVGGGGRISIPLNNKKHRGNCSMPTTGPGLAANDIALCKFVFDAGAQGHIARLQFETVNLDAQRLSLGADVMLSGYGCSVPGGARADGKFRYGFAKISKLPGSGDDTIEAKGDATLCLGDSGGPAFISFPPHKEDVPRVLIGVNSRSDLRDKSTLTSTSVASIRSFIELFIKDNGASICGVNHSSQQCRQ